MMDELLRKYRLARLNRLAKKMQAGDAKAAEQIYAQLVNNVFAFILTRVRNKTIAEDLTQDVFLKLVAKINLFNPKLGSFASWFWQIARNTLIDYYRDSQNKQVDFSEIKQENIEKLMVSGGGELETNTELKRVLDFTKTLSKEEQEIFELRFTAGLSFKEVARITQKNEGTLRVDTMRLKRKIKENFKNGTSS